MIGFQATDYTTMLAELDELEQSKWGSQGTVGC
jgi:hypothetical protein